MGWRKLFLRYLPDGEVDDFGTWGFGASYNRQQFPAIVDRWNALHKSIPEIKDEDSFVQAVPKMIQIWRER